MIKIGKPKIFEVKDEMIAEVRLPSGFVLMSSIWRTESHENSKGKPSKAMKWMLLDRPDSVGILLHDVKRDEIILVEQFRGATMSNVLEIPAGSLEKGGSPQDTAIKEVWEEVGLTCKYMEEISRFYTSPGGSPEKVILYYARVESLGPNGLISGLKSENEEILKHVIPVEDAFKMLSVSDTASRIEDAKTIIALQWLKLRRVSGK